MFAARERISKRRMEERGKACLLTRQEQRGLRSACYSYELRTTAPLRPLYALVDLLSGCRDLRVCLLSNRLEL